MCSLHAIKQKKSFFFEKLPIIIIWTCKNMPTSHLYYYFLNIICKNTKIREKKIHKKLIKKNCEKMHRLKSEMGFDESNCITTKSTDCFAATNPHTHKGSLQNLRQKFGSVWNFHV